MELSQKYLLKSPLKSVFIFEFSANQYYQQLLIKGVILSGDEVARTQTQAVSPFWVRAYKIADVVF